MTTKRFIARHGLDNNNQTITGVANPVNATDAANKNVTDSILSFSQNAFDKANAAYDASVADLSALTANVAYLQGVDNSQNTRLTGVENTDLYLQGALDQANSNIVSANTQLKSYTDGAIASANTQLKAYTDGQVSYIATVNNTQNTNITTATNLAQGAYDTANLKFNTSGGTITGPVTIASNVVITGNLTVSGNVTTISANNLILEDNMIYLNNGNTVANPDLGIAGNYNDGTYHHAGFFRDHISGVWKVFDNYQPEPDASPYIDQSNSSFRIADFQANTVTFGKINTSSSQLVSNLNAQYLNGQQASYFAIATEQNGINATQNTNITNTQTWLDANIAYISGVDIAQNASIVSANTQLKAYTDGAIVSANTQLKAYVDASITYAAGVDVAQNTNITTATNLAQGAYDKANTDYTTVVVSSGTYGGTTVVPVIVAAANGRITSISNTAISFPPSSVTSVVGATGVISNTQIVAGINTIGGVTNAALVNTSITINGTSIALGDSGSITAGATITDDTTSNATRYIMLGQATSGSYTVANTSSSKLSFNPSTGTLTTVDLNSSSDANLKTDIEQIQSPIDTLNQITGVGFNWKETGKKSYGVIAQDLEKVLPELIGQDDAGNKTVNYIPLIAFLIETVKNQEERISQLESIDNK